MNSATAVGVGRIAAGEVLVSELASSRLAVPLISHGQLDVVPSEIKSSVQDRHAHRLPARVLGCSVVKQVVRVGAYMIEPSICIIRIRGRANELPGF